jgi:hypothetical protein
MDILYFLLGEIRNLPAWTRYVFVLMMFVSILGFSAIFSPAVGLIIGAGVLVVVGLHLLFRYLLKRRRDKRAAEFRGELQHNNAATPGAVNDPARRARLDDLRKNFDQGLQRYKSTGKDLYKLPWYVIVGEPGAGKTEAIRHSDVGFPPGMQDEFQGVGGTINMNWWFTNEAVILDTAGRLLFEEVPPGSTSEWQEFLGLLRRYRPDCPVNGLLLAIPAESLIKDTPEQIKRKAGRIAQQLEGIQKALDIRFPVYVVVTKCDLLNGFRDFFEELNDPTAKQQMLGWSNPDPLDAPFRVELVDDHIYEVVHRLRRRRFGLLLDPVPRQAARRTDEVDRLYALPHSITLISPNLRQYLQAIFTAGEWTAKPLFLRGIYFTSSMREGSALDQELASALGIDVEMLPEGRAWERERSYFLHDVFTAKSFQERGLVTRATNTKQLLLKRRVTLFGTGFVAALILLTFSVLGYRSLRESVGRQSGYWARAGEGWEGDLWKPIVAADALGRWQYVGEEPVGQGSRKETRRLFTEPALTIEQFHQRLRELSEKPLRVGWVFRPIAGFGVEIDRDRLRAQRVVFEDSVVLPLLQAARQKMRDTTPEMNLSEGEQLAHGDALLALVRVESGIAKRQSGQPSPSITSENFLAPLSRYVAGKDADPELVRVMDQVYAPEGEAKTWPPDWTSGGFSMAENVAIDRGLVRFLVDARRSLQSGTDAFPILTSLISDLKRFASAEDTLYISAKGLRPVQESDAQVSNHFSQLQNTRQALDQKVLNAQEIGLFPEGRISLVVAYETLLRQGRARYVTARSIQTEVDELLGAAATDLKSKIVDAAKTVTGAASPAATKYPIFPEIRQRLQDLVPLMEEKFRGSFSDAEIAELRELDRLHLAPGGEAAPDYKARWAVYDKAIRASPPINYASTLELIGSAWKALADIYARIGVIQKEVQGYQGQLREKVVAISDYCFRRAELLHSDEFCKAYQRQVSERVGAVARFPLVWPPNTAAADLKPDEVVAAAILVQRIRADLQSQTFTALKAPTKQAVVELGGRIQALVPVVEALVTPERSLRLCQVTLLGRRQQFELSGQQTGIEAFKGIQLRAGTVAHGEVVKFGTTGRVATNAEAEVNLGRFTLFEPFHFHFHRTLADDRVAVDMPAPATWTAIQLLEERHATRIADGTKWRIALPPEAGKLIWIELRFEKAIPELETWPTLRTLALPPARVK